jgi:Phytanoyl-CoA dioxygenase (PhyH)
MSGTTSVTDQQVAFFETFGFLHIKGAIKDVIEDISQAFEEVWRRHGGGHAREDHDRRQRSCLVPFIDRHERLSALLDDPRVVGIPRRILGEDFNYSTSDGNLYVGDTPFHSNPFAGGLRALKVAFYLDRVTANSGCLRVVPGSHRFGDRFADELHARVRNSTDAWGTPQTALPAVPVESEPGDLVVFNHCIKHGSFGGGRRRRLFVINASEHCPQEKLPALREHIGSMARFWSDSYYGEIMVRTAGPERMAHLRQILANQDHLPALSERARREMSEPARG